MDSIWANFIATSTFTPLTAGHILSENLLEEIKKVQGVEAYHGIFDLEPKQTFKGYAGLHRPALGFYYFDFDDNLSGGELAKKDVKDFIEYFELKENEYQIFFSGSKGFHIYLPEGFLGFKHDKDLPNKIKKLLENLSSKFATIDKGIYNSARKFRAPFSKNMKTGLFKIPVSLDHLLLPIDEIRKIAADEMPFYDFTLGLVRPQVKNDKLLEYSINKKEAQNKNKKEISRHDKLVRFILREETASSIEELAQMTIEHDRIVNSKDPKGAYFEDAKYLKGKTSIESAKELVSRITDYKKTQLKNKDVEWEVGGQENLVFETNEFGQPIPNVDNIVRFLGASKRYKNNLWWDDFKKRIHFQNGSKIVEWSDRNDLDLTVTLQRHWQMTTVSDGTVNKAIRQFAVKNIRNSVIEWFEGLEWDGIPRINNYLEIYLGAQPSDYAKFASKNFFISMVARAYTPGCKVDNMIILEGDQGAKKSTANSVLVGDDLFCEVSESIDSKDFLLSLQGKLLVEIAELDAFSKSEMTRVKQVITCRVDRYRVPYGRSTEDNPRTCVFVGTTNEESYLNDPTGARRFWPVKIGMIDLDMIKADREQLFGEAVHRYKQDESWWEMPQQEALDQQEERRVADDWEEIVANYAVGKMEVTTIEIATNALLINVEKIDLRVQKRIAKCLKRNGYNPKTTKQSGKARRVWSKNWGTASNNCDTALRADALEKELW